jgi:hypothetical protein
MVSRVLSLASILASVITFCSASPAEDSAGECYDHEFPIYNASGFVNISPFSQSSSSRASWKLNTAIKEAPKPDEKVSIMKQKFWLEGDASTSGNVSLSPIHGCFIILEASPNTTFQGHGYDNSTTQNGCSRIFTPQCQNAIINTISSNVSSYDEKTLDNHWQICPKLAHLLWEPPAECKAKYNLDSISLSMSPLITSTYTTDPHRRNRQSRLLPTLRQRLQRHRQLQHLQRQRNTQQLPAD